MDFRFPQIRRAVRLVAAVMLTGGPAMAQTAATNELHSIAAIRNLTMEQTQQKIPVKLRAVVTFFDERFYAHFIADDTAGIYLRFPESSGPPMLSSGQEVELTGVCHPGEYAPVVAVDHLMVTGLAPFPKAKEVTYEQLASGVEDSQFVEITGVVRTERLLDESQYYLVEIATGGGRLVACTRYLPVKKPEDLLDSTVVVRGVCSTSFNHKRQLFDIRMLVARPEDMEIKSPPPMDPFAVEARPIDSLLQFSPQESYGHRVKVAGTVTYWLPGETIFIQDGEQGVEVQTAQTTPLQLGDRVEVLGFIARGNYTPMLQDAVYQKISSGQPPPPTQVTPDEALKGDHDSRLIRVAGRVLDRTQYGLERYIILQDGDRIFHAYLKQPGGPNTFGDLKNGSQVAVMGVCRIDPGEWKAGPEWRAKAFSVELRSIADITLLQSPPWWTLKKVLWVSGGLALAAFAALAWVMVLRRQVAERSRQLEVQIQERQRAERRREIEQERARVAHDLHDDLGAGLTEVNMLSTLAKSPATSADEKKRYLDTLTETALRMVTSLDEIVWAINPRNDTIASLASYFGSYAQRLLDLAGVACGLDIAEDLPERPLEPKYRQEIFFAFKEALTNVVRHARATQAWLRISVRDDCLVVEVSDDGHGFNLSATPSGSDGIMNMNERMKAVGGECSIVTGPGTGTTVRFRAPLPKSHL